MGPGCRPCSKIVTCLFTDCYRFSRTDPVFISFPFGHGEKQAISEESRTVDKIDDTAILSKLLKETTSRGDLLEGAGPEDQI